MDNNFGRANREKDKAHDLDLSQIGKEPRLPIARVLIPKQSENSIASNQPPQKLHPGKAENCWWKDEVQQLFNLKAFPNNKKAIAYYELANSTRQRSGKQPLSLFSREIAKCGSRYFIVENRNVFYDYYITMEKE